MRAKERTPISDFGTVLEITVAATPSIKCYCKIAQDKIVFCPLHREAETMLAICDYLRKFLASVKVANPSDETLIREVILPCVDGAIAAATTKES
jgi:hypothetical protein